MISSLAVNSMIHHQNSPSSSASSLASTVNEINTAASKSTTASTLSPSSSYHFNLNPLKRTHTTTPPNKPVLNIFDEENCNFNDQSCASIDLIQKLNNTNVIESNEQDAANLAIKVNGQNFSNVNGNSIENFLEAQKTFQKLTSQISESMDLGLNQRNPFHMSTISPFLVAALQQHQNLQHHLLNELKNSNNIENENNKNSASNLDLNLGAVRNNYLSNVGGVLSAMINGNNPNNLNREDCDERRAGGTGSTTSSIRSRASPTEHMFSGDDDNEGYCKRVEPEDLSLGKDRKLDIDESGCSTGAPSNWSYEEQFKQLYELSDDAKRKEWLDDWLNFMHRIGKPVTRIPIMAKQVLDLYELYRLVVQHGGLVEIINKKLWREITKGLNLPNSITSAAFTLRTQYQKYLYDYECENQNLSCLSDLQAAIEGNRREGRRTNSSDTNAHSPIQTLNCSGVGQVLRSQILNSRASANDSSEGLGNGTSAMMAAAAAASGFAYPFMGPAPHSMASFFGKNGFNSKEELINFGNVMANQQNALVQRQFEFFQKAAMDAMVASGGGDSNNLLMNGNLGSNRGSGRNSSASSFGDSEVGGGYNRSLVKKARLERSTIENSSPNANTTFENTPKSSLTTNMKLTNSKTEKGDNSMEVSMEVNGIVYQGVLFSTSGKSNTKTKPNVTFNSFKLSSGNHDLSKNEQVNGSSAAPSVINDSGKMLINNGANNNNNHNSREESEFIAKNDNFVCDKDALTAELRLNVGSLVEDCKTKVASDGTDVGEILSSGLAASIPLFAKIANVCD